MLRHIKNKDFPKSVTFKNHSFTIALRLRLILIHHTCFLMRLWTFRWCNRFVSCLNHLALNLISDCCLFAQILFCLDFSYACAPYMDAAIGASAHVHRSHMLFNINLHVLVTAEICQLSDWQPECIRLRNWPVFLFILIFIFFGVNAFNGKICLASFILGVWRGWCNRL